MKGHPQFRRSEESKAEAKSISVKYGRDAVTIRKGVIINEYESDKINPNDTILTMTPLESSRKGM